MKITLTIITPTNQHQYEERVHKRACKETVCDILQTALDQYKRDAEMPLVSGNPARANFETIFGEHVTIKVAKQ